MFGPETQALFRAMNADRSRLACVARVAEAKAAIVVLHNHPVRDEVLAGYIQALQVRIANPRSTLAQIACALKVSKDTYASRLRRALDFAARLSQSVTAASSPGSRTT